MPREGGRSREREQTQQLNAAVDYAVTIRWRGDITESQRLIGRGKVMNIRTIHDAGPRPLYLRLDCEKESAT